MKRVIFGVRSNWYLVLCIFAVFNLNSCKENLTESNKPNKISRYKYIPIGETGQNIECLNGIPIATTKELEQYSSVNLEEYTETGILDYRFARDYAFAEFIAHINTYISDKAIIKDFQNEPEILSISERPVIVYDYNNRPFYYEFPIILKEANVIATITVAAQPFNKELIHYMFPHPLQYNSFSYKYKRYVGEYPLVYYSNDGKTFYKAVRTEQEWELKEIHEKYYISDIHEALKAKVEEFSLTNNPNIKEDLDKQPIIAEKTERPLGNLNEYIDFFRRTDEDQKFWAQKINEYYHNDISDVVMGWIKENLSEVQTNYQGFLHEYENHHLRLTHWSDYCGPAIMAWLYRGKHKSYNDMYIPIYGDPEVYSSNYPRLNYANNSAYCYYFFGPQNKEPDSAVTRKHHSEKNDGGLYYCFFKHTTPMFGAYPLLDWGLRASLPEATKDEYYIRFIVAPITWLEHEKQPVVVEGIRGHAHYCGAIGYSYDWCWIFKTYLRLFVTDNGFFVENHHGYPFWSILGGLNYAWVANPKYNQ